MRALSCIAPPRAPATLFRRSRVWHGTPMRAVGAAVAGRGRRESRRRGRRTTTRGDAALESAAERVSRRTRDALVFPARSPADRRENTRPAGRPSSRVTAREKSQTKATGFFPRVSRRPTDRRYRGNTHGKYKTPSHLSVDGPPPGRHKPDISILGGCPTRSLIFRLNDFSSYTHWCADNSK